MNAEKIKKALKIEHNKYPYLIVLICAVVVLLFSGSSSVKDDKAPTEAAAVQHTEAERLEDILSSIKGVGKVKVMITYSGTGEKEIAYNTKTSESQSSSTDGSSTSLDKQAVLSGGSPMILKEDCPEVKGVIVAAKGAESKTTRQMLIEAVTTAMNIAPHRVCVVAME